MARIVLQWNTQNQPNKKFFRLLKVLHGQDLQYSSGQWSKNPHFVVQ
jgi:hypothetical protein